MTRILVTGGAGYIGAHACKALARAGYVPVTYDNLSTGWRTAVKFGPFEQGDLLDRSRLGEVFGRHAPAAVMHFAALSEVGAAIRAPGRYWRNNAAGSLNLIEAAVSAGCSDVVFSSTCAVYGDQDGATLTEESPLAPLNAYGRSKRAIEDMLADFAVSDGLRPVVFRYFNVAGADPDAEIGEDHRPETHLIPSLLEAVDGNRPALMVHGTDYPTPDGTCIRDYVHVVDLVEAHVAGLRWLAEGGAPRVFNLGTGRGFSVREVIAAVGEVTGRPVPVEEGPRRAGDAVRLVAGGGEAAEQLGWRPERSSLATMIADARNWQRTGGYGA